VLRPPRWTITVPTVPPMRGGAGAPTQLVSWLSNLATMHSIASASAGASRQQPGLQEAC